MDGEDAFVHAYKNWKLVLWDKLEIQIQKYFSQMMYYILTIAKGENREKEKEYIYLLFQNYCKSLKKWSLKEIDEQTEILKRSLQYDSISELNRLLMMILKLHYKIMAVSRVNDVSQIEIPKVEIGRFIWKCFEKVAFKIAIPHPHYFDNVFIQGSIRIQLYSKAVELIRICMDQSLNEFLPLQTLITIKPVPSPTKLEKPASPKPPKSQVLDSKIKSHAARKAYRTKIESIKQAKETYQAKMDSINQEKKIKIAINSKAEEEYSAPIPKSKLISSLPLPKSFQNPNSKTIKESTTKPTEPEIIENDYYDEDIDEEEEEEDDETLYNEEDEDDNEEPITQDQKSKSQFKLKSLKPVLNLNHSILPKKIKTNHNPSKISLTKSLSQGESLKIESSPRKFDSISKTAPNPNLTFKKSEFKQKSELNKEKSILYKKPEFETIIEQSQMKLKSSKKQIHPLLKESTTLLDFENKTDQVKPFVEKLKMEELLTRTHFLNKK